MPKYLLIGVTIYLGMMTQYFFVVYAFLLCAAYDLYLMFRREWKNVAAFSLPALAGVGGMLLTFPSGMHSCTRRIRTHWMLQRAIFLIWRSTPKARWS